jgi:hypothetical protein
MLYGNNIPISGQEVVTVINTVKTISFQVGKRHFCIKIAVFRINIGSLFDIKKTYISLAFQCLNDLCLTNLIRLNLSAS